MTIKEVFEKYQHLDTLLTDKRFLSEEDGGFDMPRHLLFDLWQAIKESQDDPAWAAYLAREAGWMTTRGGGG